jgi:hypothetical protein
MENLVTLCRFHHGLLHKGEFHIHRDRTGDLVFTNSRNEVIIRSFFPQFISIASADDCLDPNIDENTAKSKWEGDQIDIDQALQCMAQLE